MSGPTNGVELEGSERIGLDKKCGFSIKKDILCLKYKFGEVTER